MKLASFLSDEGAVTIGAVLEGGIVNLADTLPRMPRDMIGFIEGGAPLLEQARQAALCGNPQPICSVRLLAPILRPPEFLGVGLNYRDHAREAHLEIPVEPLIFNKQTSCIVGPGDDIVKPAGSDQLDYEGELGIVIGKAGRSLSLGQAIAAIYGYIVVNDVSVRDWQFKSSTHTLGKSFDTHGPIGPWIATADEVPDANNLTIATTVNDEVRQRGTTADMIFDCPQIVAFLSKVMTLRPGTIVTTGTPAGVGSCRRPPVYLRVGDRVIVDIPGVGRLANQVIGESGGSH
ncbi:MAG TPA: fumarylacetoacetate hydrolase family protein [Steroidobacteraceae bacterium]|jgi:2-keto-4-pentenoate hydratase/2-oxohepta-3-ene-1,7-dioic acid hydratase in catechol pathway